jgi:hypothetical protein
MEPNQKHSEKQLRQEVFQELADFLRHNNEKKRSAFLDRPFVVTFFVTVIGGLIITCLTLTWQSREQQNSLALQHRRSQDLLALQHRRSQDLLDLQYKRALIDRKFELLRTLPIVYHKCGSVLNSLLKQHLLLAHENNKRKSEQDEKRITGWSLAVDKLWEEFGRVETIEGILSQIEILYASKGCGRGQQA